MILGNDRFFLATIDLQDNSVDLKQRDFMRALFENGKAQCTQFLGDLNKDDMHFCRNEVMVASSCVLLSKANNHVGDLRNNVGICGEEIKLAKKYLKEKFDNFPEKKFDDYVRDLSRSVKSFI
jgi:hypothetical protein